MTEHVILVNRRDIAVGVREKRAAHLSGSLHRAFSVFLFDDAGRTLLQRRADGKYHSAGLWSNTCCSHPRPGEATIDAATRRLVEEMGIRCPLRPAFSFIYRADVGDGLIEHEFDHVYVGRFRGEPAPDPAEVGAWRWTGVDELAGERAEHPDRFTHWFHIAFDELRARGYLDRPAHRDLDPVAHRDPDPVAHRDPDPVAHRDPDPVAHRDSREWKHANCQPEPCHG